jgi:hypothetical protein
MLAPGATSGPRSAARAFKGLQRLGTIHDVISDSVPRRAMSIADSETDGTRRVFGRLDDGAKWSGPLSELLRVLTDAERAASVKHYGPSQNANASSRYTSCAPWPRGCSELRTGQWAALSADTRESALAFVSSS